VGRQAPLIELPPCRESPDARESLCAQSERNRSGLSIVEIIVVVEWWPPGEGRSIFGPPVGPFLPALISATENRDSAACKPGFAELKRRS
jgi:hypothetical protein